MYVLPGRLMVDRRALDAKIGVRIPAGQPVRTPRVTEVPQISRVFLLNTAFENLRFEPIFTLKNLRSNPNPFLTKRGKILLTML